MTSFREHKRRARQALHERMQVAAVYIPVLPLPTVSTGGWGLDWGLSWGAVTVEIDSSSVENVSVRIWTQSKPLGDLQGGGADREEEVPRILFMVDELTPVRNSLVSVALGEAYRIDRLQPKDDISVVAFVTRLKEADTVGLPIPETA